MPKQIPSEFEIRVGQHVSWYRPTTLLRLMELMHTHPSCKLVGGNTELGIEMKLKHAPYTTLIDCAWVPELCTIEELPTGLKVCHQAHCWHILTV
jgi:xanthine dehydrogenase/oxidase